MSDSKTTSQEQLEIDNGISRRDLLLGLGAAATFAYAGNATAAMPGHDHSKHTAQQPKVLDATNDCTDKGRRCIAHCMVSWTEGDLELAQCARKVQEMMSICGAFSYLLASNSKHLKEYARICKSVCQECAKECRKHDQHHECRGCAEACEALVKAINKSFA